MKRFASLFVVMVCATLLSVPAFAEGVVTFAEGNATLMRGNQTLPVTVGMACDADDIIVTQADGTVDVSLNGKVGCRVLPGTEFLIAENKPESMAVRLARGNTVLNVDKLPTAARFQVESPTAVAAVRGTQFWGRVDGGASPVTTFAVREGVVEVTAKAANKTFRLEKGQALDIPVGTDAAPEVRSALEGEMQAMEVAARIKTSA